LAELNVKKLSSSFSISSGAAIGAYMPRCAKLVRGAAFKVRAASDSQEAVREFALRGFHAKRALKVSTALQLLSKVFMWFELLLKLSSSFVWTRCNCSDAAMPSYPGLLNLRCLCLKRQCWRFSWNECRLSFLDLLGSPFLVAEEVLLET
jgi:hypothetical protein